MARIAVLLLSISLPLSITALSDPHVRHHPRHDAFTKRARIPTNDELGPDQQWERIPTKNFPETLGLRNKKFDLLLAPTDNVERDLEERQSSTPYAAVVAFGDSYSDNGRSREAKWERILPQDPYYKHHYSNGPVMVEYVASSVAKNKQLYDYAYGGAHINNNETAKPSSVPDTKTQVARHITALKASDIDISGRTLYIHFAGINTITAIWIRLVQDPDSAPSSVPSASLELARSSAQQVIAQLTSIESLRDGSSTYRGKSWDYAILTIPPLQETPSRMSMTTTDEKKGKAAQLALLKTLVEQFNGELRKQIAAFAKKTNGNGNGTKVKSFDVEARWYDYVKNPSKYGFDASNVRVPCARSGSVCDAPKTRLYWDSIHPTTATHSNLAAGVRAQFKL